MQYNPYGYPAYPQSGTNDMQGVRWVSSIEEVRAASVPYGRNIFMENNENIFHVKDSNGSISSFKFEEIPQPTTGDFVTRQEFDELRSKYEQLVQSATNAAQQQSAQPVATVPANATVQGNTGTGEAAILSNGSGLGNEQAAAQPAS